MDNGLEGTKTPTANEEGGNTKRWVYLIITLGIALRVARYLANPSLWCDEAMLSLNIAGRSMTGLLSPLDRDQGAPVGFLLLVKALWTSFGPSEFSLRAAPLAASVCSVPLFYLLAKRCLSPVGAVFALALFAASDPLIAYAAQVKQYSTDVAAGLLVLLAATAVQERMTRARAAALLIVGLIAPWFSHASTFVLAGAGSALIVQNVANNRRTNAAALCAIALAWLASFGVNYAYFLRNLAHNSSLLNYWASDFAPMPPRSVSDLSWYAETAFRSIKDVYGNPPNMRRFGEVVSGLGTIVALTGVFSLYNRSKWRLFLLFSPIVFTLAASALHKYPFRGRLTLFLIPIYITVIAEGVHVLWSGSTAYRRSFMWLLITLLIACPVALEIGAIIRPPGVQETKPILSYVRSRFEPGDTVFLYGGSEPAALFYSQYSTRYSLPSESFVFGGPTGSAAVRGDLDRLKGRVWVLVVHFTNSPRDEEAPLLYLLDARGVRLDETRATGASCYLYQLK